MPNNNPLRLAFAGFRHAHILALYKAAQQRDDIEIVAASEDHEPTRRQLIEAGEVTLTHESYTDLLEKVECNAIAVGDYYGRRGRILIDALTAGRHVIADKPICTNTDELAEILHLATTNQLSVGCQLDMRDTAMARTMRRLIDEGTVGEVHTVCFSGQHPLLFGTRPEWYFEEGKHGGTINDIAIHAVDFIPWMTDRKIVEVTAARAWNARLKQCPHFQDGAQLVLKLDNGGGVMGDVSYLAPSKCGYSAPQYWRITCHGTDGVIEGSYNGEQIFLATNEDDKPQMIPLDPADPNGYLDSFVREVRGENDVPLSTHDVLEAARITLAIQASADKNVTNVSL